MQSSNKNKSVVAACFMGLGALAFLGCAEQPEKSPGVIQGAPREEAKDVSKDGGKELKPFSQEVPAAAFKFDMVPIAGSGKVKPFYIGKTELTWEAFDPFVFRLDEADGGSAPQSGQGGGADAVSRPSKPYLPPDRGFGHEGYAAISMSYENAKAYCTWLSAKSGKKYRLPTVAEWQLACGGDAAKGDKGAAGDKGADKPAAWLAGNSGGVPHPVGTTMANANGLFDMRGNVMEWCTDEKGEGVACGGCYKDDAATCTTVHASDAEWNKSDPQIPKSKWWLADGPFVGFRVVCEP